MEFIDDIISSKLPKGLKLQVDENGTHLIADKFFAIGQIVYVGNCKYVKSEELNKDIYLVNITNSDEKIEQYFANKHVHFVWDQCGITTNATGYVNGYVNGYVKVYGFDCWVDHSCDPTIIYKKITNTRYIAYALKNIQKDTKITCNYIFAEYNCMGHSILKCNCNSKHCECKITGFGGLKLKDKIKNLHKVSLFVKNKFFENENKI